MKRFAAVALPCFLAIAVAVILTRRGDEAGNSGEPARLPSENIASGLAADFSGQEAYRHVEKIVAFGPRPPDSEGYAKTLDYLERVLDGMGWKSTRQSFKAATPDGPVRFTNLLARHKSAPAEPASLPWLVGGHLDSKILPGLFVGANDGGSSTGILVEMARVLATDPASAAKVEIVFFDGEEAFRPGITATDGLYGSKYFAHSLASRSSWPAAGVVLDIVGDPNHVLLYSPEAPEHFASTVESCAERQSFEKPFRQSLFPIIDDHVPLQNTGIPCLHVIGEFSRMSYWHTPADTLDKVDAAMLEKVGRMTLDFLAEVPLQGGS